MTDEKITTPDEAIPAGEDDVTPSDGGGADDTVSVKDILSEELGKEFSTDEAALKAVKDTFSYVGKIGKFKPVLEKLQAKYGSETEAIKAIENTLEPPKVDTSGFASRDEVEALKSENFYSKNPSYEPYRNLIEDLRKATGKNHQEIIQSDNFKNVFEKANAYETELKSKSVLQSNSRLGQVKDKISEARQNLDTNPDAARKSAVEAVIEAYEME